MNLLGLIMDAKAKVIDDIFPDTTWENWINEAQREVVRRTRILEKLTEVSTVPSQRSYPIGPDFWMPKLVKFDTDVLRATTIERIERALSAPGRPGAFVVWGREILLDPVPSMVGDLKVYYYAWPQRMEKDEDEPEIPEAFHSLLPAYAAYRARAAQGRLVDANFFYSEFENGIVQLIQANSQSQNYRQTVVDVRYDPIEGDWW